MWRREIHILGCDWFKRWRLDVIEQQEKRVQRQAGNIMMGFLCHAKESEYVGHLTQSGSCIKMIIQGIIKRQD